jgi:flagellar biosynthetic protein FliQ
MGDDQILALAKECIFVTIKIAAPIMIIALVIGVVISLFQALTQIQESTLTFVPKFFAILASMVFLTSYMNAKLVDFFNVIMQLIAQS